MERKNHFYTHTHTPWWNTSACLWLRPRWRSLSRRRPSSSYAGPGLPPWRTLWWRYLQEGNPCRCSAVFIAVSFSREKSLILKEATRRITTVDWKTRPNCFCTELLHGQSPACCSRSKLGSWRQWFLKVHKLFAAENTKASVYISLNTAGCTWSAKYSHDGTMNCGSVFPAYPNLVYLQEKKTRMFVKPCAGIKLKPTTCLRASACMNFCFSKQHFGLIYSESMRWLSSGRRLAGQKQQQL